MKNRQPTSKTLPLLRALPKAEGRSEFVIVVVADVRGFSEFSRRHESPDIAMYIKRLYQQLMIKYFFAANFVKPTGDGLLMTFPYSETTLHEVAKLVIESCVQCLSEFSSICRDDPMINFEVPEAIGFGIARGTACCLYSGQQILDYSGHLLNLASRLMDLARPSGIVIDGNFLKEVLPDSHRNSFKKQNVYLRSLAEDTPITVLYLTDYVRIPDSALNPMRGDNWRTITRTETFAKTSRESGRIRMSLEALPISDAKVKVNIWYRPKKGGRHRWGFNSYRVEQIGPSSFIFLDRLKLKEMLASAKLGPRSEFTIEVHYVPSPLVRT